MPKVFIKADIESQRKRYNAKVWKKMRRSECENYLSTIQEQELPTKYLRYKPKHSDKGNILNHNNKCRLCMSAAVCKIHREFTRFHRKSWFEVNV